MLDVYLYSLHETLFCLDLLTMEYILHKTSDYQNN